MVSSIYFQTLSLFYMLLLTIVFFSKKRIKSIENTFFVTLIFTNLIGLGLDIASTYLAYVNVNNPLLNPLCKLYLIYLIFVCLIFTAYVLFVSTVDPKLEFEKQRNKVRKLLIIIIPLFVILSIIVFCIPLYNVSENGIIYTKGPGADLNFIVVGICAVIWIISLICNYKTIINKKYLPIFSLIICVITAGLLQNVKPELLIVTSMCCYVVYIMFFTIENPDMKLINELNIAKEQAVKANNSKSEFLSSMSHEIRTPLNAIVGFSQILLEKENLPEDSKEEVSDIVMASQTLLEIVNGILDISKIEANKLEIISNEYSTHKILDDLVALTKARMGEKPLEFRTKFDPALPEYLFGDASRVKQVILNLLTNSVKYTKEGYVEFKVDTILKNDICRLIISVEDSGIGIKPEQINKLFRKFERLNESGNTSIEGTGLGLAITKKLVELMNGKIFVQSIFGKGSKFTVVLDQKIIYKAKETTTTNNNSNISESFNVKDKKVLVVDDNNLNLKVAEKLLTSYGLQVETINNGFSLIDKMKAGEVYDLILLDDMMPKMSGTETLKNLRQLPTFSIPTVALTANAIEGMREKYLSEGFDEYLAKPIEKTELNRIIAKYLSK